MEPLLVGRNTTVKSYGGYDILDTSAQEGITAAEVGWKQLAGAVSISGREEFENSGKPKIISLLKSKTEQLELSMQMELSRMMQGDGTGNGGKDITGLALWVEDGTAWSTVGGIDSNTYPYWRNQWTGGAATFASVGKARMTTMYNSASRGNVVPTLIATTQYLYEQYELSLTGQVHYYDMRLADAGFMNLMFKQTPMVFDEDIAPGMMEFLSAQFLKLIIGKGKNFVVLPFTRPDDQDARVSHVIFYGNLVCRNRARQGRLSDLT